MGRDILGWPNRPNVFLNATPFSSSFTIVDHHSDRSHLNFTVTMEGELPSVKKWIMLYPVYINSKKTVAEGRRIGISKSCENPTCAEIGDCCNYLKLPFAIEVFYTVFRNSNWIWILVDHNLWIWLLENVLICWWSQIDKAYPRDFMQRGRVRVLLKKEDGTLINPAISSSKLLNNYKNDVNLHTFIQMLINFI